MGKTQIHLDQLIVPGHMVEGQGIVLGVFEPKDEKGKMIGEKGIVFVAPEDLTKSQFTLREYEAAAIEVGKLRNWHSHDGVFYPHDKAFYEAYQNNSYKGQWILPPRPILDGKNVQGKEVHENHMHKHKDTGAFKGTYVTRGGGSDYAPWYWSSSEPRDNSDHVRAVRFTGGNGNWVHRDGLQLSVRPVRVVRFSDLIL